MSIVSTLNKELLAQPFGDDGNEAALLEQGQRIAYGYAKVENSLAVLSDLKSNRSYIYSGGFAEKMGLTEKGAVKQINSIWEEDIFNRIHPDDLAQKHLLELQFFHLLKTLPIVERSDYHIVSKMRMKSGAGEYVTILHRMFYVCSCPSGNLWLAVCLYNFPYESETLEISSGIIINSATGDIVRSDKEKCVDLLSSREKEILQLIDRGKISKDISGLLSISKNTVDRHRQNILEKLRVKNSIEACRIAKLMKLI